MDVDELTQLQRAGLICWILRVDETLTTSDLADLTGMSYDATYRMICHLSERLPLYQDDKSYTWRTCHKTD